MSENTARVIRSTAETWFGGNVTRTRAVYDRLLAWALTLTPEQRTYHKWGAWHANDLLKLAAMVDAGQ